MQGDAHIGDAQNANRLCCSAQFHSAFSFY
jgi:hypothetical protein